MQAITILAAVALLLAAGAARAGCDYPDEPLIPDASESTKEELQSAIAEFKDFQAALEEYRACLEQDYESLDEESRTEERRALFDKRHDAAVDREQQLADRMNEQIRLWNSIKKPEE